jgi:hypothetical protein
VCHKITRRERPRRVRNGAVGNRAAPEEAHADVACARGSLYPPQAMSCPVRAHGLGRQQPSPGRIGRRNRPKPYSLQAAPTLCICFRIFEVSRNTLSLFTLGGRSPIPAVVGPGFSDELTHDDRYVGESNPEIDNSCPTTLIAEHCCTYCNPLGIFPASLSPLRPGRWRPDAWPQQRSNVPSPHSCVGVRQDINGSSRMGITTLLYSLPTPMAHTCADRGSDQATP